MLTGCGRSPNSLKNKICAKSSSASAVLPVSSLLRTERLVGRRALLSSAMQTAPMHRERATRLMAVSS